MKLNEKSRRYRQSCQQLKSFLLEQIPEMVWMYPDYRDQLITVVNHIIIERGAKEQLWDIVMVIVEMMADNDIDDIKMISFVEEACAICGRKYHE